MARTQVINALLVATWLSCASALNFDASDGTVTHAADHNESCNDKRTTARQMPLLVAKHRVQWEKTTNLKLDTQKNPVCYTRYEDALASKIACAVEGSKDAAGSFLKMLAVINTIQGTDFTKEWIANLQAAGRTQNIEDINTAAFAVQRLSKTANKGHWDDFPQGRMALWSLVAAAPSFNGKNGVSLFRTLLEADYMNGPHTDIIKTVKNMRQDFSMWQHGKGRDRSSEGNVTKKITNIVFQQAAQRVYKKLERRAKKHNWFARDIHRHDLECFSHMALNMGITFDTLHLGLKLKNGAYDIVEDGADDLDLKQIGKHMKHYMILDLGGHLYSAWQSFQTFGMDVCETLSSFSGFLAIKNLAGDDTNPVAKEFHRCDVPLIGGVSGSILEYMAFFYWYEPDSLTAKSVLGMMSALTALGGHGLSEQIAPVQALIKYLSKRGTSDKRRQGAIARLTPFLSITAPLDLDKGCDASSGEEAAQKMPSFLQEMQKFISEVYASEIKESSDRESCTQEDFADVSEWLQDCEKCLIDESCA